MKHSSKHAKNIGKASLKSSSVRRRSWDIAEKRLLVAEAREKGLRATAQNHDVSYSALHTWTLQDFSNTSDTKKRLPGAGRRIK